MSGFTLEADDHQDDVSQESTAERGRAPLKTKTGQIVNSVEVTACEAQRQDAIALFGRTVRLVSLIMETIVISRSPKNE